MNEVTAILYGEQAKLFERELLFNLWLLIRTIEMLVDQIINKNQIISQWTI